MSGIKLGCWLNFTLMGHDNQPLRLLILGGTVFVGRHIVEEALRRDFDITLFNRGQSNANLYPNVKKLVGDRDGGLDTLIGGQWDAVIDTCGYFPRIVADSATLLSRNVDHYTFISSISVYEDISKPGINEQSPVGILADPDFEEVTGESYGPFKALCEQVAEEAMPGRVLNVRPGLIVGPYDPTDRFSYWLNRIAKGGEVLAPGPADAPVQFIDGRDLAVWLLDMITDNRTGTYNATGPDYFLSFVKMLSTIKEAVGGDADFTWVDPEFLFQDGVQPWMELPLWLGPGEYEGMLATSVENAVGAGLSFRPLAETARDTMSWLRSRSADYQWKAGISLQRERDLLEGWHSRR